MTSEKDQEETGILLVDKPAGWTSHDVVDFVRKKFDVRKVGHGGTLDPNATGLLVLMLGRATKLSSYLSSQDKLYTGTMKLGQDTTTHDPQGEVVAEFHTEGVTTEDIQRVVDQFTGEIEQVPPMTSAKKQKGKPLYKLAHKGKEVQREPRPVTVYRMELKSVNMPFVSFEIECSKGTYIRTLCADIGAELGCGGHLYELRRLRSGKFSIEDAYDVESMNSWERNDLLQAKMQISEMPIYTS